MLLFNSLVPERVYRIKDRFTLPYPKKNMQKGNLITVFSKDMGHTAEFLQSQYLTLRNYNRYYLERILKVKILSHLIRITNNQKELYDQYYGNTDLNLLQMMTPTVIKDFNVIYELGQYLETINSDERLERKNYLIKAQHKFELLVEKLVSVSKTFSTHSNKYLYIPVHDYISNPKDATLFTKKLNMSNPVVYFCKMMQQNPETFNTQLKDWTIVFMNMNELFYINCNSVTEETFETVVALFKRFRSKKGNVILDDDETNEIISDTTKELTERTAETQIQIVEKVSKHIDAVTEDLPIDQKIADTVEKKVAKQLEAKIVQTEKEVSEVKRKQTVKEEKQPTATQRKTVTQSSVTKETKTVAKTEKPELKEGKTKTEKLVLDDKAVEEEIKIELKNELDQLLNPSSRRRIARLKKIQDDMSKLKIQSESIEEIRLKAKMKTIEKTEVDADVINPDMKEMTFTNFDRNYNQKLFKYDLANILTCFQHMDRPLYLIDIKVEDTSTVIDKKYTYSCVYEDEYGRRHHLKFDLPKLVNDKFIHLNKSDKLLITQIVPLPVTKTAPDTVQIASYQKIFINRFGQNVSPKILKFHKIMPEIPSKVLRAVRGNNLQLNLEYLTTLEYDELSQKYTKLIFGDYEETTVYLNQKEIRELCRDYKLKFDPETELPFAIVANRGKPELITIDIQKDVIKETTVSPIDFIVDKISEAIPSFKNTFAKVSVGKRFLYTRAAIMKKKVPLVILLAFLDGLEPLMNRMRLGYTFYDKRPKLEGEEALNKGIIQFSDGWLVYDNYPFANALLMNGFSEIPTKEFSFMSFSGKDIYYDIFAELYGRRDIGNAFENFNQTFIDPITKEVLEDYNLPTNFIDLLLYANTLLENNAYDLDGDLKNYRIRTNEMINAHLYKVLAEAYRDYRATADHKQPKKFSIKQNAIIEDLMSSQLLEEYSTLNPILEVDRMRSTSFKGIGGCNLDQAYSIEKRAYNESMLGILAQSSPISGNIGISRTMSIDPKVKSLRGYIDPGSKSTAESLKSTQMLSGAELLVPLAATHDDPQRVSMSTTQSRHTLATLDSDPPLFGYGFDKVLPYVISDRFAFKAKKDGKIVDINEKLGYMLLEYADGTKDVVDLTNRQEKNAGGGFYITNKLTPNKGVGESIKAGEVVARNDDFFIQDDVSNKTVYKSGPLTRVGIIHSSSVFEDSCIVTERLAKRMSSLVTDKKDIVLGKNSNIYHMVQVGDEVKATDPLIIFDESYQDEYLNKLLSKINESEKDSIIEAGRTPIKAKFTGKIIDIKIYYTVPKEELSDSLRAIIDKYEANIRKRHSIFKRNGIDLKDLTSLNETLEPIKPVNGKVKGVKMNDKHVLIEFYIAIYDKFGAGDKLTMGPALKAINQTVIPEGKEPYLASDPNEKVDILYGVSGIYARMTNSFNKTIALNSVILGLEKKLRELYIGKFGKI